MDSPFAYRERLLPLWWAWLLPLGVVMMVAVAYGAALGAAAGWAVGLIGGAVVVVVMRVTSLVITVTDSELTVGPATLPLASVDVVQQVDAAEIARLRGPGSDARLYTALRSWSARGAVLVTLRDEADPHPAWLFSSRNPTRVTQALAATMGRTDAPALEDE